MEDEFIDEERIPLLRETKTTTIVYTKIRKQRRLFFKKTSNNSRN